MPAKRVLTRKIKRILELHHTANLSNRAISRSVGVGRASVSRLLERAKVANLSWPLPEEMTDAELEAVFYPATTQDVSVQRPVPNWGRGPSRTGQTPVFDAASTLEGVHCGASNRLPVQSVFAICIAGGVRLRWIL